MFQKVCLIHSILISALAQLCKWRRQRSWSLPLLSSSEEQSLLRNMLLSESKSPNDKIRHKYHLPLNGLAMWSRHCCMPGWLHRPWGPSTNRPRVVPSVVCVTVPLDCPFIYTPLEGLRPYLFLCLSSSHSETAPTLQMALWVWGTIWRMKLLRALGLGFQNCWRTAAPDRADVAPCSPPQCCGVMFPRSKISWAPRPPSGEVVCLGVAWETLLPTSSSPPDVLQQAAQSSAKSGSRFFVKLRFTRGVPSAQTGFPSALAQLVTILLLLRNTASLFPHLGRWSQPLSPSHGGPCPPLLSQPLPLCHWLLKCLPPAQNSFRARALLNSSLYPYSILSTVSSTY